MKKSTLKSPKNDCQFTFENYFYHIKPLKNRPLTPPPNSFNNLSKGDRSFRHAISKSPSSINIFPSSTRNFEKSSRSPFHNIYSTRHLETEASRLESSTDLVEYETENSFQTKQRDGVSGRELSSIHQEEKNLKEYMKSLETKIKKCEEEERNIKKKIEITSDLERKFNEKRMDYERMKHDLELKKRMKEQEKNELRQKNFLEKKLHQQNLQKTKENLYKEKLKNALKIKENKENLMGNANFSKKIEFSEKLVKVNTVKNLEKKLKQQKGFNSFYKGDKIKSTLADEIEMKRKYVLDLKERTKLLEEKEKIVKEKLEQTKQTHLTKFLSFQQTFSKPPSLTGKQKPPFTNCSTATFVNKNSINSEIVTFDDSITESNQAIHVKTSIISIENNRIL